MRLHAKIYRALLRLLPREFRRVYGSEIAETFDLRTVGARRMGALRRGSFFLREALGLLWTALRARWESSGTARIEHRRGRRQKGERMNDWLQDLRHASRRLLRSPAFSITVVVSLALGIGANSAIFSLVSAVVLDPLPYPRSAELISVRHSALGLGEGLADLELSTATYFHFRELNRTLEEIAIFEPLDRSLTDNRDPLRAQAAQTTYTLADVLKTPPLLGRFFNEEDRVEAGSGVVVLSHGLWTQRYGRDPAILGKTIRLDNIPHEVIGVMPRGFAFPSNEIQLWIPLFVDRSSAYFSFSMDAVARLKPGITPDEAWEDLHALMPRLEEHFPGPETGRILESARLDVVVKPFKERIVGEAGSTLWILMGSVAFVLLAACANVSNLFLIRGEIRRREGALRRALGAGTVRMVRYFISESAILTFLGGALGLALAWISVRVFVEIGPYRVPRSHEIGVDLGVLAFSASVTIAIGLLFGFLPILLDRGRNLSSALKEGDKGARPGGSRLGGRHLLIVSEVALSMILLVGSGLMVRSFWQIQQVELGFDREDVLSFEISLPPNDFRDRDRLASFHQDLLDRLQNLPGVDRAGAVGTLPVRDTSWHGHAISEKNNPLPANEIPPIVSVNVATEGYFETMRIRLIEGRTLERADHENQTGAAVVSRALADRLWPGESAVGKQVYPGSRTGWWYTVVGVVGNVRPRNFSDDPWPIIYVAMTGKNGEGTRWAHTMTYVVRAQGDPLGLVDLVGNEVRKSDPDLPLARVAAMEHVVSEASASTSFTVMLLGIAALVALALGLIGIYGVTSYTVGRRRSEIGIRLALGADAAGIRRMVVGQGSLVALAGLVLGLLGALALSPVLDAVLFQVSRTDPWTYAAGGLLLLASTLAANSIPASRAARVDPVRTLRSE